MRLTILAMLAMMLPLAAQADEPLRLGDRVSAGAFFAWFGNRLVSD